MRQEKKSDNYKTLIWKIKDWAHILYMFIRLTKALRQIICAFYFKKILEPILNSLGVPTIILF